MAKQTVTLRLDEDDLTFLAGIEVAGATNLSEKIRALLADARAQREGLDDFGAAYDFVRGLFAVPERRVHQAEVASQQRSELVARVLAWMPETAAFVLAGSALQAGGDTPKALRDFERGLGERAMVLTESMLQLAQAGFPGCHAPETLSRRARFAQSTGRDRDSNPADKE
ncbi:hypothetical protein [Xanthomonas sp. XNM01]|uniref:hypothetical protein n=1 Tax=Xanthomonas sp. XNM01 TaxID=2769289 RepID=UPI001782EF18|nr:hypothetical protein [Xanthomonas sp. XNM01]MBD9369908.1 hypothetical protein [Xanthomonas sp. XNM01]